MTKAITFFNADQYKEGRFLINELIATCLNVDLLGCLVVATHVPFQLGTKALGDARYDEAADDFTTIVNSGPFLSKNIHETYEDLTVPESRVLVAHSAPGTVPGLLFGR